MSKRFPGEKFIVWLIFLFCLNPVFGQKNSIHLPLDKLRLISTFGELRLNHFHSGLDFSSFHRIGLPVYAIDSGYVSRITISRTGYGRALYITHYKGLTSVYAHLSRFNDTIQKLVEQKQYQAKNYEITLYFRAGQIPIKKGQIVAYTGNSGYSMAPHLHFEIRDAILDFPMNPFQLGFNTKDTRPPKIFRLAVYPASDTSLINGKNQSFIFSPTAQPAINTYGSIFFGIETYDYVNDNPSRKGIYSLKLLIDSELKFWLRFDRFFFQNTRDVNTLIDYKNFLLHRWKIMRTYVTPNNRLCIYLRMPNNGIYNLTPGKHEILFKVSDYYGNTASYKFFVNVLQHANPKPIKHQGYLVKWDKNFSIDTLNLTLTIPARSLYENTYIPIDTVNIQTALPALSPIYKIGSPFVPLQKPINIAIRTQTYFLDKKLIIVRINHKGQISAIKSSATSNPLENTQIQSIINPSKPHQITVTAKSYELGSFFVSFDTTKPEIKLISPKTLNFNDKLIFKITDNLSGIKTYNVYVNGKWTLFEYDAKTNRILTQTDKKHFKPGLNTVKIIVTDYSDNTNTLSFQLQVNKPN